MALSSLDMKQQAAALGFDRAGVIPAAPAATLPAYERWIGEGMHGKMGYMARPDRVERRRDLDVILPGVRSMVIVGLDYHTAAVPEATLADPSRGRIAAYAWGADYHDIMTPRLEAFASWLAERMGGGVGRVYVDTGAVLERAHAYAAGMGFVGKNTMLIHARRGSSFFLGEILTDIAFDTYDEPGRPTMCGSCTRCLVACPTDAFPAEHVLDARRCISYLTIENKGWIDREMRPLMGNWVFGCDICQDVCPWQRFSIPTDERAFYPTDTDRAAPRLVDLLALDEAGFRERFHGSPVYRIRRDRLVRNACIAAGNWGSDAAVPALKHLLDDANPLVRGHAVWGLARIQGRAGLAQIERALRRETDDEAGADMAQTRDEAAA